MKMNPIPATISEGNYKLSDTLSLVVSFERENDFGAPWDEEDGHGPVSDWTTRDKRSGELVISTDRRSKRFYDFAKAVRIAKREKWGVRPEALCTLRVKLGREPTRGDICAEAARLDFEHLRGWANDEWEYVCVCVKLLSEGEEVSFDSLGMVESFGTYKNECAADMARALVSAYDKEADERTYWEARDVETL